MRSISFRSLTRPAGPAADLVSAAAGQTQARSLPPQVTDSHARPLKCWTSQHAWPQRGSSAVAAAAPALQQSATAEGTLAEQWREAAASSSEDDEADVETMHAAARSMEAEPGSYSVVNFYHLVDVPHPHHEVAQHREWLSGKAIHGRIYISTQGINAQLSGPREDAEGYARWTQERQVWQGLQWNSEPVDSHQFPKLRLKFKPSLVQLSGGMTSLPITDPQARAKPLQPKEWQELLCASQLICPADSPAQRSSAGGATAVAPGQARGAAAGLKRSAGSRSGQDGDAAAAVADSMGGAVGADQQQPVLLDLRNGYEWDAGHFQGAARPLEDHFHETPTEATPSPVPAYLQGRDKDTPVMMYCTGGIRCDIYSTYLRRQGFNNLFTLEGGVQNYLKQAGGDMWVGSLFVFDERLAIPPPGQQEASGELPAAVACACGQPAALPHLNCANIDCNRLFLACSACQARLSGCCCEACMQAPRLLRPPKSQGYYRTYDQYLDSDSSQGESMASGRGDGRRDRRRKRHLRVKAEVAAMRAEGQRRKALWQAEVRRRQASEPSRTSAAEEEVQERRLKLEELRDHLHYNTLTSAHLTATHDTMQLFGQPLQDCCQSGRHIPVFRDTLTYLIKFQNQQALAEPRLFTANTSDRKTNMLRQAFELGRNPLVRGVGVQDPTAVAGLLKEWLRALPEPIMDLHLYGAVLQTQQRRTSVERLNSLQRELKQVAPYRMRVLYPLLEFLHHHAVNQPAIQAAAEELARIFTPWILRKHGGPSPSSLSETCTARAAVTLMILDYRILFGQAAAGGEAQKSFDTGSAAQAMTTGAAAKACSMEAALKGQGPAKADGSCESQAPADMELEVPRLSSSSDDSAGNSDDSSDGSSSDDEMDVAEEPCVFPPALCVQVASSTPQSVEPAAGSLELAAQEAQDPQLCRSVDCLLCDSLEALLF